jgi:hypothetical protein
MRAIRRPDLSDVSRWVWLLIGLALAWFVLQLVGSDAITLPTVYSAFAGATPALFAAALMYVAPRERLIRIAALTFGFPVAVTTLIAAGLLVTTNILSSGYAYLGPRLLGVSVAFNEIGWIFPVVAVFCIAVFIGPVRGRGAWLVVAIGAMIAVTEAATVLIAGVGAQADVGEILLRLIAQVAWLAWACLLAVTLVSRMYLIAIAAASHLVGGTLSLIAFPAFQAQLSADPSGPLAQALLALLWAVGVVAWGALIVGILRELPRVSEMYESDTAGARGALSLGR